MRVSSLRFTKTNPKKCSNQGARAQRASPESTFDSVYITSDVKHLDLLHRNIVESPNCSSGLYDVSIYNDYILQSLQSF